MVHVHRDPQHVLSKESLASDHKGALKAECGGINVSFIYEFLDVVEENGSEGCLHDCILYLVRRLSLEELIHMLIVIEDKPNNDVSRTTTVSSKCGGHFCHENQEGTNEPAFFYLFNDKKRELNLCIRKMSVIKNIFLHLQLYSMVWV